MFGFSYFKIIGALIALAAISLTIYLGYRYVVNLQEENARLHKDIATLEISNKQYEIQIENVQKDLVKVEEDYSELNDKFDSARERITYLSNLFADHDFIKLVEKKPGLITIRMQKATKKIFDEIEKASANE